MVPGLFFSQLVLIALVWLGLMFYGMWPSATATCLPTPAPTPPVPKRTRERPPFTGLTTKPLRRLCAYQRPVPTRPYRPAPTHRHDARTLPSDRRSCDTGARPTGALLRTPGHQIRSISADIHRWYGRSVSPSRACVAGRHRWTWRSVADAPRFVPDQRCTMQASRRASARVEARHTALYGASCLTPCRGTRWPGEQGQSGGDAHQALPVHAGHGDAAAHALRGVLLSCSISNIIHTLVSPSTATLQNIGRPISTETPSCPARLTGHG
jgi:hypothetical protein